jgi:hypothetical protein
MAIVGIFLGLWMLRRVHKSYSRGYVSEWKMTHKTGKKFYKVEDPISFWTHITAESSLGVGVIVLCLYCLNLPPNEGLPPNRPVFLLR